ncbi:MAG: rhamnulokinase [Clostridia bacterium]|nr:rhamnulokinase [Clostridia bacterium]
MKTYLAVDIGASSGRHILGHLDSGKIVLEEIYRFENYLKEENGSLVWDTEALFFHVKEGLRRCKQCGKVPRSVAIDTWGVDYVLLDEKKNPLLPVYAYRDGRCERGAAAVGEILPDPALYRISGIQKQSFNTVYQLYCDKESGRLARARHFLMMPEYLSFRLCGRMANEYTNASTTNLLDAEKKEWSPEILNALGLPTALFLPPSLPGTSLGHFTEELQEELGFDAEVLLAPSHDTASAVAAIPLGENDVYISSGTWSLVGTENLRPVTTPEAEKANFTNEGGVEGRFRFLKNIMGMWIFQSIRRELDGAYSYDEMMHLAEKSTFCETFDPTSSTLLAPKSMLGAIRSLLGRPELPLGDVLSSAYHSLAASYKRTVEEIEAICQKKVSAIHIVGGGSRDAHLNRLTAEATGKRVFTGLSEATALGNLLSQIMKDQGLTLSEARQIVKCTFTIKEATK